MKGCAIVSRVGSGTGVLTISFLATFVGGGTVIRTTESVFRGGVIPIIAIGVVPVVCILWVAP
ncbi:MAG: hypothetical protein MUC61_02620 [Amoebophilaceae bacterium]|nr:hypothetical protein [Amoebophilaceae bacterium]